MSMDLGLLTILFLVSSLKPSSCYQDLVNDHPLACHAGYGQRGKLRSSGVEWIRTCKFSKYCWEATTENMETVKTLFDYPWDDYYDEYYVRGCSGDYGTQRLWSPFVYTSTGEELQKKLSVVPVNITVPPTITERGGTVVMNMQYACTKNFCSSSSSLYGMTHSSLMMALGMACFISALLFA